MIDPAKLQRRLRAWQSSQMDCGGDGCSYCRVCRRLEFLEYVSMVAPRDIPCSVESNDEVDRYIRRTYGNIVQEGPVTSP